MANEVEVKITASTDALSEGMDHATNKVQSAAADINRIADTIKNAFDGVRESLKNIDVSLNIDMSNVQQKLSNAANTIKSRINSIVDDASIKLKIDTTSLDSQIGHAENLIRSRLSSLPIQNVQLDINIHDLQQKFNQLGAQTIKVKPKLDTSALTTEIALIKNKLNVAFSNGIKVKVLPTLLQADISNLRTKLQGLTNKTYKVKLGIDLTYLNNQINIARSMLSNINSGLVINIDATSNLLRASLDRLKTSIDHLRTRLNTGGGSGGGSGGGGSGGGSPPILAGFGSMFTGLMAGYTGVTVAISGLKKVISTQREFDILNAQLETATKSSEGAKEAFATLQDFAKKTPYSLEQAVTGFTKLVNLGLTPSERAMMSYGNTSAAMGKDLMQLVEAVADATTGEFERLKEFGIKSKQQGDKVSLTFQGVTKTIGNNAKEIENYLIAIGENEFAGAMAKRVDTLDGAIASLSDTWDALFRAVSNLGVGDVIKRSVNTAEESISSLIKVLESGAVEAALRGMATAFNVFSNSTQSDMNNMKSAFSGLGDYLVSSWQSTLNEINALGNIFSTARSYVQKAAVSVAAGVDIVSDPFNKRTTNQQKTDNWESSLSQIDTELNGRIDALKNSMGMNSLLQVQGSMIDIGKIIGKNGDPLAKFKIAGDSGASKGSDSKDDKKSGSNKSKNEADKLQNILNVNDLVRANATKYNYEGFENKYNLPNGLLSAVNMQETKGRNVEGVQTKYGTAKGNFQLLDGTAKRFGVDNPFDTKQAAEGASKYLRFLLDKYGDIDKAVSAYHAGEGNVDRGTGLGPINRQYVKNVKGYMAGINGVDKGTESNDYDKSLQDQIRRNDQANKEKLDLEYKYASEVKKVQIDLDKELDRIGKSTASGDQKRAYTIQAEKEAKEKLIELELKAFEDEKLISEQKIQYKQDLAQRLYEQEKAQIQVDLDAGLISNVEKVKREKQLEDLLYKIKRDGLLARLDLEEGKAKLTGKNDGLNSVNNSIAELDSQKAVSNVNTPKLFKEAEMADFDKKFGGLTSRISGLWDNAMQSMMNGTLTWRNATNAVLTEMAGFAIQTATKELQDLLKIQAVKLAKQLGFIGASTTATVSGEAAKTGAVAAGESTRFSIVSVARLKEMAMETAMSVRKIMKYAYEATAKAMASVPPPWNIALGAIAFAGVAALAGKVASARGGYDIPSGVNPMTQLHEEEMVLPKQHANTIRALGKSVMGDGSMTMAQASAGGGEVNNFNFKSWDSKDLRRFAKKHGREFVGGMKGYKRNFGK